jgi:asparagine synthase (glutamine-hydrolysing)
MVAARYPEDEVYQAMTALSGSFDLTGLSPDPMAAVGCVRSPRGLRLAWDGRLDNAAELRADLGLADPGAADAEVVAAAFERLGAAALPRLLGDFALALHDPRAGELILARDPFGTRPLFWHATAERLVWGSRIAKVLSAARLDAEPDETWIAQYLVDLPALDRTPYRGVRVVQPGHAVRFTRGGRRDERFYRLRARAPARLTTDADYEACFRELFLEAVRVRARGPGPVFTALSGGLDSSSVACAARRLVDAGEATAADVLTVSFVYERSPTSDERPYIRAVEERLGRAGHHVGEDALALRSLDAPSPETPSYMDCFPGSYARVTAHMREARADVLLTGVGGDALLLSEVGAPLEIADHLVQRSPRALLESLGKWHRVQRRPYVELLWEGGLLPLLPAAWRTRIAPERPAPAWVDARFARRVGLGEASAAGAADGEGLLPSLQQRASFLRAEARINTWQYCTLDPAEVQLAHPFLHRPLVEMCLSAPLDQLLRGSETRSLMRRALRDLLPEKIARRRDKRGPDEAFHRALARQLTGIERLLAGARVTERGYVDGARLREALDQARFGKGRELPALLRALALEYWLRGLSRPRGAAVRAPAARLEPPG